MGNNPGGDASRGSGISVLCTWQLTGRRLTPFVPNATFYLSPPPLHPLFISVLVCIVQKQTKINLSTMAYSTPSKFYQALPSGLGAFSNAIKVTAAAGSAWCRIAFHGRRYEHFWCVALSVAASCKHSCQRNVEGAGIVTTSVIFKRKTSSESQVRGNHEACTALCWACRAIPGFLRQ